MVRSKRDDTMREYLQPAMTGGRCYRDLPRDIEWMVPRQKEDTLPNIIPRDNRDNELRRPRSRSY